MSGWIQRVAEATTAALETAEALPPDARRDVILGPLRATKDVLARGAGATPEAVQAPLLAAMQAVVVQAAGGYADLGLVDRIAAAFNAVAPDRLYRLDAVPPHAGEPMVLATWGMPAVKPSRRAVFVRPSGTHEDRSAEAPPADATADSERDELEEERADEPEGDLVIALFGDAPPSNWRETEGPQPDPPLVGWKDGGETLPVDRFYALVANEALEALLAYGRDRSLAPLGEREDVERRALQQVDALAVIGDRVVEWILDWWSRALELPGPWCSWAAAFALGCLEGPDALVALAVGLERLPPDAGAHAVAAAEALAVAPHPDRIALGWDLVASPHPVARAVGLDVLSREAQLPPTELRRYMLDASIPVIAAAVRAVSRLSAEEAEPLVPVLARLVAFPHVDVAWPAARAMLLWGRDDPYHDVHGGGRLARVLGVRAAELLVLAGDDGDLSRMQTILSAVPPSRGTLSTLARFGHPGAWAYLTHQLGSEDLVDDAADALVTLFGPLVAAADRRSVPAWRSAIAANRFDAGLRYRRGEPWRPRIVADECMSLALSRQDVELRVDELALRASVPGRVDLGAWWPDAKAAMERVTRNAERVDRNWKAGRWRG